MTVHHLWTCSRLRSVLGSCLQANISWERAKGDIDFFFIFGSFILFLLRPFSAVSVSRVCLEAKILTEIFEGKNSFYNEITFSSNSYFYILYD